MIVLSVVIAILCAFLGHVGAVALPPLFGFRDTITSGMMAVAAGLFFALAAVFWPRYGALARLRRLQHPGSGAKQYA